MPKPTSIIKNNDYKAWVHSLKAQIQSAQIKAAVSVNKELLKLYWLLGSQIVEKQQASVWGDGFIKQLSHDLRQEFPDIKGFSVRNLELIRKCFLYWHEVETIAKQVVAQLDDVPVLQIPWGQNLVIISKSKSTEEAQFYVQQTMEKNWSRAVLTHQIESGLYQRQGKAVHNFTNTLPKPHSDLAAQTLKDPYCFDFLTMRESYDERELEAALVDNIMEFLLELGAGFAFVGKQYKLPVGDKDFYIDLLFYHVKLHCFVVVELKTGEFKPEFAGKLNFYISAVDDLLASEQDQPTIGMLICKSSHQTIVEYALKDMYKPIGVSEYELTRHLPDTFKSSLPSIEEIEAELGVKDV
ncbi:MAG: DUF1016 family protein [Mariprofundaceae bacterium]|nr:DUF1016 family protein [Mariprofundaceae bacterium]